MGPRSGHGPASPWLGLAAGGAEGPSLVRTGQLAPLPPGSLWCDRVMVPSPALHALVLASLTCGHSAVFRDPVQRGGGVRARGRCSDGGQKGRTWPCSLSALWSMADGHPSPPLGHAGRLVEGCLPDLSGPVPPRGQSLLAVTAGGDSGQRFRRGGLPWGQEGGLLSPWLSVSVRALL